MFKIRGEIGIILFSIVLILIAGCTSPATQEPTPSPTPIITPTPFKPFPVKTATPNPTPTVNLNVVLKWGYWTADNKEMKIWGTLENLGDETLRNVRVSCSLENCGNIQSQSFNLLKWQKKDFTLYISIPSHYSDLKSRIRLIVFGDNLNPIQESSDWFIIPPQLATPTPTLAPPIIKITPTQMDVWDFISYCQHNWVYEYDVVGEPCQSPQISLQRLSGDCDDFAVMMAYYLQEVYRYDTVIINVNIEGNLHAVCFVAASQELAQNLANQCQGIPTLITNDGRTRIAVDWQMCPSWTWTKPSGSVTTYEWSDLVGKPI